MSTTTANRAERRAAASTNNRAKVLGNLVTAVWVGVTARDAAIEAYKAAATFSPNEKGVMIEDEETRNYVLRTYLAKRLFPAATACTPDMLTEAQRVLALPGAGSKSQEKRTEEQERFCTGARQYIFSIRQAAGIQAADNRGGANNVGPRAPQTPDGGDIPIAPPAARGREQKFETGVELRAHFFQVAQTMAKMVEKYNDICDPKTRAVVARFVKDTATWAPAAPK